MPRFKEFQKICFLFLLTLIILSQSWSMDPRAPIPMRNYSIEALKSDFFFFNDVYKKLNNNTLKLRLEQYILKILPGSLFKENNQRTYTPQFFAHALVELSFCFGIDPLMLAGMFFIENTFRQFPISPTGAVGISQMTPVAILEAELQLGEAQYMEKYLNQDLTGHAPVRQEALDYFQNLMNTCPILVNNNIRPIYEEVYVTINDLKQFVGTQVKEGLYYYASYDAMKSKYLVREQAHKKQYLREHALTSMFYGAVLLKTYLARHFPKAQTIVKKKSEQIKKAYLMSFENYGDRNDVTYENRIVDKSHEMASFVQSFQGPYKWRPFNTCFWYPRQGTKFNSDFHCYELRVNGKIVQNNDIERLCYYNVDLFKDKVRIEEVAQMFGLSEKELMDRNPHIQSNPEIAPHEILFVCDLNQFQDYKTINLKSAYSRVMKAWALIEYKINKDNQGSQRCLYEVQAGDTPSEIAVQFQLKSYMDLFFIQKDKQIVPFNIDQVIKVGDNLDVCKGHNKAKM